MRAGRLTWENVKLREISSSIKYCNGSTWPTNNCGDITVIGQMDYPVFNKKGQASYKHFKVQFEDGNTTVADMSHILLGEVRNKYRPSIFERGFVGEGEFQYSIKGKKTKFGRLWDNMFHRCYAETYHVTRPNYKDCEVSKRWYYFQDFCKDIQHLKGFSLWKKGEELYHLDKDIRVKGNKVYSKDTCQFVTLKENCTESNQRNNITGLTYIATRLSDGYQEEFTNQTQFARDNNMVQSKISSCIQGDQTHHHNWTFEIKEELNKEK